MAATENPDYTVVERIGDIEIRDYPPMILASATVGGDRQGAANRAFRILAGFIFGDNRAHGEIAMTAPVTQSRAEPVPQGSPEKIAMTAPVTQAREEDGRWRVDFMMPSRYTLETLPAPTDPRVKITRMAPHRAAAIRFTGRLTDGNFDRALRALDDFVAARGLRTQGAARFAYYDGPFTPFFLRRNEVIYRLAED